MKKKIFIVAAVIISSQVYAQTDSSRTLDAVVVTATKSPLKQSQTGKVITVIDQKTLQLNAGKTLTEILNLQVGMFINGANNNMGTNQDNYLRGAASGNTLILIDGIPVGDPSLINNSFDLNNIDPNQVERVEILKGAQSTLWGSDAIAGVINIITKKGGEKTISPTALVSYGSYNTVKINAGLNGTINKLTYNLNYGHINSDGFSAAYDSSGSGNFDKDGFNQDNVQANIGYEFSPKFSARVLSNYSKYKTAADAGAFKDDKDFTNENSSFINSLALVYKIKRSTFYFTNTITKTERLILDDSVAVPGSSYANARYKGNSFVSELFGNIVLHNKLSLTAGAQYMRQSTDQQYHSISMYGPYDTGIGDSAKASNISAYASLLLLDLKGFNAEAGIRYNNNSIYGSNVTYSFNPSYAIDENTRVFINLSSAYKIPSLYQLYDLDAGDKNLKPEESTNYELGVQTLTNNKRSSFRLVGFKREIRNLIVYYTDPSYDNNYINRDKQNDYGFEIESNIGIGKIGQWLNNFTYVDGEGINDNIKVKNLYRRPNFTFNSILTLQPIKGLTIMPSFRFIGTRLKGQYDAGPAVMPEYYTLDFYAGYNVTKQVRVFADLRNITDQKYFDIPGYNSRASNYTVGLSANF